MFFGEQITGDLELALTHACGWMASLRVDGPDLTVNAHKKLAHEAVELASELTLEEAADVLICLAGTSMSQDWSLADLARAVEAKVIVNEARSWMQELDGTWQHVPVGRA